MTTVAPSLRIGEVASRTGTTPRTIRYYEELGLLPATGERVAGSHRLYGEDDVQRLEEILRLKQLLGLSLDEVRELVAVERARAALRSEWHGGNAAAERRREIVEEALGYVDRQLELAVRRRREIEGFEEELTARRRKLLQAGKSAAASTSPGRRS